MKEKVTVELVFDDDLDLDIKDCEIKSLIDRHKYKRFYDELYDTVFRPVIKHGCDCEIKYDTYEEIWEKIISMRDGIE